MKFNLKFGISEKVYVAILTFSIFLQLACKPMTQADQLPDPYQAGWEGKKVCEILHEDERLRVLRCSFAPGVGHERHYHPPHFGYAVSGSTFRIKDTTGTREVSISSGTSFHNDGVDWHEVINIGDSTGVFLIVEPKE